MDAKVENTEAEVLHLRDLQRAMFVKTDVPANTVLTRDDLFFAIPYAKGDYVANDFSKYVAFTRPSHCSQQVGERRQLSVSDSRSEVLDIVRKVAKFTSDSGIVLPKGAILEVSHHYGLEKFHETGMSMVTVVNEEYCKKVLIMLPGQNHPEQYHEKKKETFHVVHGSVDLVLDGDSKVAKPGDVITIEPGVGMRSRRQTDVSSRKSRRHISSMTRITRIRRLPRTPSARHSSISGLPLGKHSSSLFGASRALGD